MRVFVLNGACYVAVSAAVELTVQDTSRYSNWIIMCKTEQLKVKCLSIQTK